MISVSLAPHSPLDVEHWLLWGQDDQDVTVALNLGLALQDIVSTVMVRKEDFVALVFNYNYVFPRKALIQKRLLA